MLAEGERTASELVATLPNLTQPAVSRHLRVLREAGLVQARPDGQRRIYALRPEGLIEIVEWIGRYRRYWPEHPNPSPPTHGSPIFGPSCDIEK